jgi:hypothetical protein
MDHSLYIKLRQEQFQSEFFRLNPTEKQQGLQDSSLLARRIGGLSFYNNGKPILPILAETQIVEQSAPTYPSVQSRILAALQQLFVYNASISLGPTRCARVYYLFFFSVATAGQWVNIATSVRGTHDNWNWDIQHPVANSEQAAWMVAVLNEIMPSFVPGYVPTEQEPGSDIAAIKEKGKFSEWLAAWNTWWAGRAADGSVAASVPPTTAQKPNGTTYLEVTTTQDFTNATAYPEPTKWTPLSISGAQKNYLTYGWNDVTSSFLNSAAETTIKSAAATAYLGNTAGRTTEIAELLALANGLTDEQKMIAEFWAGGPNTVAPPGIAVWTWKQYVSLVGASAATVLFSGLDLAINLFEASRLVWGLKKQYAEARPIQEIRRRYPNMDVTHWDGTIRKGNMWVPYQMTNFVTPPFPDFPSGHSTFSQAMAMVMNDWFGPAIPMTPFTATDLNLISPIFGGPITIQLTSIPIQAKSSETQPDVVPAAPLALSWSTWQEMSDSAGVSRQYGGIHAASAHVGGQTLANQLHVAVKTAWAIGH